MTQWPMLDYDDWRATCDTLHAHTQVLGKLAATLAPPEPQLQHAALRLTPRRRETPAPPPPGGGAAAAAGPRRLRRAGRGARPAQPRSRGRAQRRARGADRARA